MLLVETSIMRGISSEPATRFSVEPEWLRPNNQSRLRHSDFVTLSARSDDNDPPQVG